MSYSTTQRSDNNKIRDAVINDIDKNKQHYRDLQTFLIKKYKKAEGRKKTSYDDDDFGIGNNEESEGSEKDFLWKLLQDSENLANINPRTLYDWAILLDKKAKEKYWTWSDPIQVELFTGYSYEPYKKVMIKPEMVDIHETYLEDIQYSEKSFCLIEKWLKNQKIMMSNATYDHWVYEITQYYFKNKIQIEKDIVFRPLDNDKKRCFYELEYFRIEEKEISKKIEELQCIENNIKKTKKQLSTIIQQKGLTKKNIEDYDFNIHQYICLLANYWYEHKDEFRDDLVFHPLKNKKDMENHCINVYSINMNNIISMSIHIQGSIHKQNIDHLEKIKKWSEDNQPKKFDFENMNLSDWKEVIKNYHKIEKIDIQETTIYYPKWKKESLYSFNHHIIDHKELTKETDIFDILCLNDDDVF